MEHIKKSLTELIGNTPLLELTNYNQEKGVSNIVAKLCLLYTSTNVLDRLAAHQDVPMLQHLFGGVLLEVDYLKQLYLIPLRG